MRKRKWEKFQVCEYCGAHLDYGEKCDCQKKKADIRQGQKENKTAATA